jgi:hypothetical protein
MTNAPSEPRQLRLSSLGYRTPETESLHQRGSAGLLAALFRGSLGRLPTLQRWWVMAQVGQRI